MRLSIKLTHNFRFMDGTNGWLETRIACVYCGEKRDTSRDGSAVVFEPTTTPECSKCYSCYFYMSNKLIATLKLLTTSKIAKAPRPHTHTLTLGVNVVEFIKLLLNYSAFVLIFALTLLTLLENSYEKKRCGDVIRVSSRQF